MRPRRGQVARPVSRLRRVEHARAPARRGARRGPLPSGRPRGQPAPSARRRGGGPAAPVDGPGRGRPRARRRAGSRLARAPRRLAGHRQVHPHHDGPGPARRGGAPDALRLGRGVPRPGSPARRAAGLGRAGHPHPGRDLAGHRPGDHRGRAPGGLRDRLRADAARRGRDRSARLGRAGARGRGAGHAGGEVRRHRGPARGPRDQGGRAGRSPGARAPRRLRAAVRGRARTDLPDAARPEEPVRVRRRRRGLRDARLGAGRGARRLRALRRRGHACAGIGGARRDGGVAAPAGGGPGAGQRVRAGPAAARRLGHRPQPPGPRPRRAGAPRRGGRRGGRRVRQRRRRRAGGRAGRGSGRGAGRRGRRPRGAPERAGRRPLDVLRRDRAHGRAAVRRPSGPPEGRGGEVRPDPAAGSRAHGDPPRRRPGGGAPSVRGARGGRLRRVRDRRAPSDGCSWRIDARPIAVRRAPVKPVCSDFPGRTPATIGAMASRSGDELLELESRQEPRLVKALEMVAPGTAMREGIDNILHARTGGLIVIGDPEELSLLFSGGIRLDIDYTPALLYQVAKMDGAIILNANGTKITWANVQLMPDPTILSLETGTRHRTAERVSKQTDALVIAISQRREVVSLYVDGAKYILEDIPVVLAKANQALATLDKYRTRLDQVSTRLTALEFEGGATLHDVLTVLQRSELVTRMAVEIERYIVELGTEGRLIEMQLEETMVGTASDKAALVHDYLTDHADEAFAGALDQLGRLPHQDLLDFGRLG